MERMRNLVRRRKDDGFTLIELMIVIAVIGILAVVLVPKFMGVKSSAKLVGVTTNARELDTYITAQIDNWNTQATDTSKADSLATSAINSNFSGANVLTNPISGNSTDAYTIGSTSPSSGEVVVTFTMSGDQIQSVSIEGYDNSSTPKQYGDILTVTP